MPHFPKPFFKKARGCWFVQLDGKQIKLGTNKEAAFKRYHELMATPQQQRPAPTQDLVCIIDAFLGWVEKNRAADTYEWYRYRLQRFVDRYPQMQVRSLRPYHVDQWVDEYELSKTSKRNYFRSIKTCLNWALKQGFIESSPLDGLETPGADRKNVYLPPDGFAELLTHVHDDDFRDLLVATYHTGCRPQESLILTAEHVDLVNARWVLPQEQAKGKKAPRIIYLDDVALAITQRLVAKYPTGNIFRNSRGLAWTTESTNCAVDRVQIRMGKELLKAKGVSPTEQEIATCIATLKPTAKSKGVERQKTKAQLREEAKRKLTQRLAKKHAPRYSLYSLRHSWATNALKRGVDPLTVALLMGHKDPSMLARVYQHLAHSPDHMREQARRAAG
ncbi:MAG: tyrosine-type recombinase/integrase [bacterium]|nr:tyrosine-type recombinase/integrase [bacterium]